MLVQKLIMLIKGVPAICQNMGVQGHPMLDTKDNSEKSDLLFRAAFMAAITSWILYPWGTLFSNNQYFSGAIAVKCYIDKDSQGILFIGRD